MHIPTTFTITCILLQSNLTASAVDNFGDSLPSRLAPRLFFLWSDFCFPCYSLSATRMPRGIAHISILSIFIANGPFSLISTHKWHRPEHFHANETHTGGEHREFLNFYVFS